MMPATSPTVPHATGQVLDAIGDVVRAESALFFEEARLEATDTARSAVVDIGLAVLTLAAASVGALWLSAALAAVLTPEIGLAAALASVGGIWCLIGLLTGAGLLWRNRGA